MLKKCKAVGFFALFISLTGTFCRTSASDVKTYWTKKQEKIQNERDQYVLDTLEEHYRDLSNTELHTVIGERKETLKNLGGSLPTTRTLSRKEAIAVLAYLNTGIITKRMDLADQGKRETNFKSERPPRYPKKRNRQ